MTTLNLDHVLRLVSPRQLCAIVESKHQPFAVWAGAVRSGKTFSSLVAFLIAVKEAPRTGDIMVIGKSLQTIERNLLSQLKQTGLFGPLARRVKHTPGATTATILGRTVHLVGATDVRAADRIQGSTLALAYVDEATLVPQPVWMMLISRLSVSGARLLATTNPAGPAHWLRRDFILRGREVDLVHFPFTLADNPSLEQSYVDRLHRQYVGLYHRRYIKGEWCLAEGAVYEAWDPDRMVVKSLPLMRHWLGVGVDYGTVNPFSAHTLGLGVDDRLYLAHEFRYDSRRSYRKLTDAQYSRRLRDWMATAERPGEAGARGVHPDWIYVDPSAASFIQQLHSDGQHNVTQAVNEVVPGINTLASVIALDKLRVHESCTGIIDEFPGYSWDPDAAQKGDDRPIKVDDHGLDDARYVVHSTEHLWRPVLQLAA